MKYELEVTGSIITITATASDGYKCGFDIHSQNQANDPGREMARVFNWLFPRLENMEIQITETPEKRGKLRKKPDAAILADLVEVPSGQ